MNLPDFGSEWSFWDALGKLLAIVAMLFGVTLCAGSVWLAYWAWNF
jgi:hypothetical protein